MPTPTPARLPTEKRPRRWVLAAFGAQAVLGAIGLYALFHSRHSDGDGAAETPDPASEESAPDEAAPARAEFRAPRRRKRAPSAAASVEPRPPPADLAEVEAELEKDPESALAWIRSIMPENDTEAEQLLTLEIRALVRRRRIGTARALASSYYERWPNGPNAGLIERLTGAHPNR